MWAFIRCDVIRCLGLSNLDALFLMQIRRSLFRAVLWQKVGGIFLCLCLSKVRLLSRVDLLCEERWVSVKRLQWKEAWITKLTGRVFLGLTYPVRLDIIIQFLAIMSHSHLSWLAQFESSWFLQLMTLTRCFVLFRGESLIDILLSRLWHNTTFLHNFVLSMRCIILARRETVQAFILEEGWVEHFIPCRPKVLTLIARGWIGLSNEPKCLHLGIALVQ